RRVGHDGARHPGQDRSLDSLSRLQRAHAARARDGTSRRLVPVKMLNMRRSLSLALASFGTALLGGAGAIFAAVDYSGPRPSGELHFARLWYEDYRGGGGRRRGGSWDTDWPEAEEHFYRGVSRLSK